jgi:glycosyltransferase involved in cell wall biosynthesis
VKVIIHQKKITVYREPFFSRLSRDKGFELTVTYYDLGTKDKERSFRQNEKFDFNTINLSRKEKSYPLLSTIRELKPDVIVLGEFDFIEDLFIWGYCKFTKIPILRWTGGFVPTTSNEINLGAFYKTRVQKILKFYHPKKFVLLHCNNGFIVYSEFARHFIQNILKIRKKIFVAPNSPNTDEISKIRCQIIQNPGILNKIIEKFIIDGYKTLLLVGRLNKERKIDLLLDTFEIVHSKDPKTCLFIVGEGEYLAPARQSVEDKKLDKVFFTGAVYDEGELGIYYSLCDIYLTTGVASLTIKSAMAYGKPVVSMDNGLEIHAINNGVNGYVVEYGNVKEMADRIIYLLQNDKDRELMGVNAYDTIKNELNISKMTGGFINALYSVCQKHN